MKYTKTHEWIDGDTVGISDYAKQELGEVIYIELPKPGQIVKAGEQVAVIESTKVASEIYSPVSGTITSTNPSYLTDPTWLYKLTLSHPKELNSLLSQKEYEELVKGK
jgi:glycine cleavage system H protein